MLRVGLTGGVACGKSTVAGMLVGRGAHFLQADTLAHQLYAPGTAVYDEVVRHFGRDVLAENGTIDRHRLANMVFPDRIGELNRIVHPAVIKAQRQWLDEIERKHPQGIAVVEAALMVEAGAAKDFDKVIVVTCNFERKVEHYAGRAGISPDAAREEVARRSAAQFSDEEKARHASYVIDTSGSLEETERQVEGIWKDLETTARQEGRKFPARS